MIPYAFVWEKGKTMDFSETIVVYDLMASLKKKMSLKSDVIPFFHDLIHVYSLGAGGIQPK